MDLFVDGLNFGEGPRWHDGELWYSDFYQHSVYAVSASGERRVVWGDLDDRPSGLGWMPDGSLLVVKMKAQQVWRDANGTLVLHADLSHIATGHCNDMVVAADGTAYVGNFGFDYEAGESAQYAKLARVAPDGTATVAAEKLRFPNGSVITEDGSTLIVGETTGGGYEAWTINADGSLSDRRRWADTPGMFPDGCTSDAEGAIWFADAFGNQLVRVREGGEIVQTIPTPQPVFACALGGENGSSLFALCAPGSMPDVVSGAPQGAIFVTSVEVPHAGRP